MNGNELYDLKYITLRKYIDMAMLTRGYYYYPKCTSEFCLPYLTLKEIDLARETTYDGTNNKGAFYFWVGSEGETIGNNDVILYFYPTDNPDNIIKIVKNTEFFKSTTFTELLNEFEGILDNTNDKAKYEIHKHNIETILALDKLS